MLQFGVILFVVKILCFETLATNVENENSRLILELQRKLQRMQVENANLVQRMEEQVRDINILKNKVQKLENKEKHSNVNDTGSIAFAAELTHTVGPGVSGVILPFSREILNVGIGYSLATATFTAAFRGIYFFSWSVMVGTRYLSCSFLALNNVAVIGYGMHGTYSTAYGTGSSQTAILVLNTGDQVNIKIGDHNNCQAYYGTAYKITRMSSFKGFLIKNMEL